MAAEAGAHEAWVDAAHLLLARARGDARDAVRLLEKAAAEGVAEASQPGYARCDGGARIAANATEAEAHFAEGHASRGRRRSAPCLRLAVVRTYQSLPAHARRARVGSGACVAPGALGNGLVGVIKDSS